MEDDYTRREEERKRLKEAYKEDLRLRREFLERVRQTQTAANVNRALQNMEGGTDDTDDWIFRLNQQTALNEAKAELALEDAPPAPPEMKAEDILAAYKKELAAELNPPPNETQATNSSKTLMDQETSIKDQTQAKGPGASIAPKSLGDWET